MKSGRGFRWPKLLAVLLVVGVGGHILDAIVTLRAWSLETNPVATGLGPEQWLAAKAVVVALSLLCVLGLPGRWRYAAGAIMAASGLAGPVGNLSRLGLGPTGQMCLAGLAALAAVILVVVYGGKVLTVAQRLFGAVRVPTPRQAARVAVVGLVIAAPITAIGATGEALAAPGDGVWVADSGVPSSPVISDGLVVVGSQRGDIEARYAANGSLKWDIQTGAEILGAVHIENDIVYAASRNGTVHAVGLHNGTQMWEFNPDGHFFFAPVQYHDGTIYTHAKVDGVFFAIDATTGQKQWELQLNTSGKVKPTGTLIENDIAYVGTEADELIAINLNTQQEAWKRALPGELQKSVTSSDGTLYAPLNVGILALDESGNTVWSNTSIPNTNGATINGSRIFVSTDDGMRAFDKSGGAYLWSTRGKTLRPPTTVGGHVYAGANDGGFYRFDVTDGNKTVLRGQPNAVDTPAVIANNTAYIGDSGGNLRALEVTAKGPATDSRELEETTGHVVGDGFGGTVNVSPTSYVLSGRVRDSDGTDIEDATIVLKNNGTVVAGTTSNSSGYYNLSASNGTYTVDANAGGYNPESTSVSLTNNRTLDWQLSESTAPTITGVAPNGSSVFINKTSGITVNASIDDPNDGNVTVEWLFLNESNVYEQVASTTVDTSGGPVNASASVSLPKYGRQYYLVRATGPQGRTDTSSIKQFRSIGQLFMYKAHAPTELITDSVDVTIRGLGSSYQRTTTTTTGKVTFSTDLTDDLVSLQMSSSNWEDKTIFLTNGAGVVAETTLTSAENDTTAGGGPTVDTEDATLFGTVKTDQGRTVANATVGVSNQTIYRTQTTNATGQYAFSQALSNGKYNVSVTTTNDSLQRLEGDVDIQGRTELTLVLGTSSPPTIDESAASPTGAVTGTSQTLSVDVDDDDFRTSAGDTLTATFSLDGAEVGTDTVSQAGTVSTGVSVARGSHTWSVAVTDEYGNSVTSSTFSFETLEIFVHNETSPNTQLDISDNATAIVYNEESSELVNVTGDTINLPATSADAVVLVNADGYLSRTVTVSALAPEGAAFLPSRNVATNTVVFSLDDSTGRFPPRETTLRISRPLTINNTSSYHVISADQFGATGEVPVELVEGVRYRLTIENRDGEVRRLEHYTPRGDATAVLPVSNVQISGDTDAPAAADASLTQTDGQSVIRISYLDEERRTSRVDYIVQWDNGTTADAGSLYGTFGVASVTVPVPFNESYVVLVRGQRGEGTFEKQIRVGKPPDITERFDGVVDPQILSMAAWLLIVPLAGLFVIVSGPLGALVTAIVAGLLSLLGFLPIEGAALGISGAIAVLAVTGYGGDS